MDRTNYNVNTVSLLNQQLFDSVELAKTAPYDINGLTFRSNNNSVHPRDEAGNIILQENSETNPLLIIETTTPNIVNSSVLRVVDTTFRYFQFPVASSIDAPEITAEDLALDLSAIQYDPIYARYKPSTDFPWGPTGDTQTQTGYSYSGLLCDEVVEGLPQTNRNCYTVSKEVKNSGKDLRFRFKIAHNFNSSVDSVGGVWFSIIKTGPDSYLNREYRTGFASEANSEVFNSKLYTAIQPVLDAAYQIFDIDLTAYATEEQQQRNIIWNNRKNKFNISAASDGLTSLTLAQLNDINLALSTAAKDIPRTSKSDAEALQATLTAARDNYNYVRNSLPPGSWGYIANGDTQFVYGDIVIPNYEFEIGDIFSLGGLNGQPGHALLSEQTYWVITDASKNVDLWNQEISD